MHLRAQTEPLRWMIEELLREHLHARHGAELESAFSTAFKRVTGNPPSHYRAALISRPS